MKEVFVIGGGPSGMMAAITAAQKGNRVTLFEKNDKLGKKLFITGKGRCNVTNASEIEEIIENIPGNGNFLYSALYTFTNNDLMNLIENTGVPLKIERGNRVFPKSDKSSDIIKAFESLLKKLNVKLMLNTNVDDIIIDGNNIKGIKIGDKINYCDSLIIATGGKSYPLTGSTGDGYVFANKAGHSIEDIKPSLVPLIVKEDYIKELQGLSLKNVSISVKSGKKTIFSDLGEMIFTHFGISGPLVLSMSRYIIDMFPGKVLVHINLKPGLTEEQLDKRIQRDFEKYSRKMFKNSLDDLLPQKLIPVIIKLSGIDEEKEVNQISKIERANIVNLLRDFKVTAIGTRPIDEAIITSGGVCVKEINPSTMESKLVKGLFYAGEVIDVDALTGGFNLQIAFSTGYLAGFNC